ncbi:MAG: hypothetical protein NVV62_13495 [Terricaulis sp.]|nr:hypothetical protein [Terricaulis sp.]
MIVALCCLTNVTEGFDVVSLAYAAPVMTREWGTPAAMLGLVFSFVSVGLAIGRLFLPLRLRSASGGAGPLSRRR